MCHLVKNRASRRFVSRSSVFCGADSCLFAISRSHIEWGYDTSHKVEYVDSSDSVVRVPGTKHKVYEFFVRVGKHQHSDPTILKPTLVVGVGGREAPALSGSLVETAAGAILDASGKDKNGNVHVERRVERAVLEVKEKEIWSLLSQEEAISEGAREGGTEEEEEWQVFGPSQASKKAAAKVSLLPRLSRNYLLTAATLSHSHVRRTRTSDLRFEGFRVNGRADLAFFSLTVPQLRLGGLHRAWDRESGLRASTKPSYFHQLSLFSRLINPSPLLRSQRPCESRLVTPFRCVTFLASTQLPLLSSFHRPYTHSCLCTDRFPERWSRLAGASRRW